MPSPVRTGLRARWLARQTNAVTIHAETSWFDTILAGKFDFFVKIEALLRSKNIPLRIARLPSRGSKILRNGKGAHIIVADRPQPGSRILHAMPSHIWGFWHLDPLGALQHSQITEKAFNPSHIDPENAQYFFDGVTGHMLRNNVTRHAQKARIGMPLPPARAAIFTQHIDEFKRSSPYVETLPMLKSTLLACAPGRVTVKLHPHQRHETVKAIKDLLAQFPHAVLCTASVHDQIAAAEIIVTQNSTAGFEALMQRKPIITCAPCAYHHATLVVKDEFSMKTALETACARQESFPFEAYFYWFLAENCFEPAKPEFTDRVWSVLKSRLVL